MLQPAGQNAFRDDLDSCRRADLALIARLIANRFADGLAEQRRHAGCRRPRRQAARFEHDDAAGQPRGIEQLQRDNGGFTGTRGSDDHCRADVAQGADDVLDDLEDGQVRFVVGHSPPA